MASLNEIADDPSSKSDLLSAKPPHDKIHRLPPRQSDQRAPAQLDESTAVAADLLRDRSAEPQPALEAKAPAATSTPTTATPAAAPHSLRRPILFALLPVALAAGAYFYVTGGAIMSTDNAYVQADTVGVSNDISGIVKQVLVRDNQAVAKGDVLFKLDAEPYELVLQRADAQLGMVRNDLLALRTSYKDTQAQIEQAKSDIDLDRTNFERQQKLAINNYTPQATLDAARNTLRGAEQKLASLNAQLAGITANLNGDPNAAIEDHPRYKDALAARNEAARQLSHTSVRAPFSGIVTNVPSLQPGQYLAASATAFNIVSDDHVWVEASPKETELTSVVPGQKASITVDTYPGIEWSGTVDSISPASASSFSLLPAENTSGNWVKVVQRIPMRVRVENQPDKPRLRVGMSVEVDVDTGHPRGLPSFLTGLFGTAEQKRG